MAAAKPYDLQKPEHLLRFLVHANIKLVKFDFLQGVLRQGGRCWPRRGEAGHGLVQLADIAKLEYCKEPACLGDDFLKAVRP